MLSSPQEDTAPISLKTVYFRNTDPIFATYPPLMEITAREKDLR